ncbi:MAG: hypothetical protein AAFY88_24115, partial [Acidobacteriota bacterium]
MSRRFEVKDGDGRRAYLASDFPLAIGGAEADLRLDSLSTTVAWLGLDAGDLFVQTVDGDDPVGEPRWLETGHAVDLGAARLLLESGDDGPLLRLVERSRPAPPRLEPPPRAEPGAPAPAAPGPTSSAPAADA